MNITVLTVESHPINEPLIAWQDDMVTFGHQVEVVHDIADCLFGSILFLVSFPKIISKKTRDKFDVCLVPHASPLPSGRGWSPHIWYILNGSTKITVSLIEAKDKGDSGDIWLSATFDLDGDELYDEINNKLFTAELHLMTQVVLNHNSIVPTPQSGKPTYFRKRTPEDSALDINLPLKDQFNLLRVADPDRYPAYFDFNGERYSVTIRKSK